MQDVSLLYIKAIDKKVDLAKNKSNRMFKMEK